jgi:sporulation protein YlmC with PRC-barrel domain
MIRGSKIIGMEIYNDRARRVGEVRDLVLDEKRGVLTGFTLESRGPVALCVPFETVKAIGDIVLVATKEQQGQG